MNHGDIDLEDYLWDALMHGHYHTHAAVPDPEPPRPNYATDNMIVVHETRPASVDTAVAVC